MEKESISYHRREQTSEKGCPQHARYSKSLYEIVSPSQSEKYENTRDRKTEGQEDTWGMPIPFIPGKDEQMDKDTRNEA
jgi:hypothetical protein